MTSVEVMQWVDGNDIAGAVAELFAADPTIARGRCLSCGQESMLAQARVYNRAPGMVARCPACEAVLLRLVRAPGRAWLDLRGLDCLEFTLPE
jgi:hypothetical protein